MPTPKAWVADNDLAVGRAVEAIAHSPYWEDTTFFILEDDARTGRTTWTLIAAWLWWSAVAPPRLAQPLVDSTFYTTIMVIAAMEELFRLHMNNNDAFAPPGTLFAGTGDQPPYKADYRNRDNGLLSRQQYGDVYVNLLARLVLLASPTLHSWLPGQIRKRTRSSLRVPSYPASRSAFDACSLAEAQPGAQKPHSAQR